MLSLMMVSGCASSVTKDIQIETHADPKVQFRGYQTYAWLGSAAIVNDPAGLWEPPSFDADAEIMFLLDRELRNLGLLENSNDPDLFVVFAAGVDMAAIDLKEDPDSKEKVLTNVPQGGLLVSFIDRETGFVIWAGVAAGEVQGNPDVETVKKRLDYAVTQLIKQVPDSRHLRGSPAKHIFVGITSFPGPGSRYPVRPWRAKLSTSWCWAKCLLLAWICLSGAAGKASAQVQPSLPPTPSATLGAAYTGWTVASVRLEGMPEGLDRSARGRLSLTQRSGFLGLRRAEFTARRLEADRRRIVLFLARNGYPQATNRVRFEPDRERERVTVVIEVDPGLPTLFGAVEIIGLPVEFAPLKASLLIPLVPGRRFEEAKVELVRGDIAAALHEAGYSRSEVEVVIERPDRNTAGIRFQVRPGDRFRFGTVTVTGSPLDLVPLAEKTIDIAPGTIFNPRLLREARGSLRKLDLFRQIRLDTCESSSKNLDLSAQLAPRKFRTAELSVGTWTDHPIRVRGVWTHHNIFKRGRGLAVTASLAQALRIVRVDTWWQALLRVRSRAGLGFKYEVQDENSYYQEINEVGLSNLFHTLGDLSWRLSLVYADNKVDPRTDDPTAFPDDAGKQLGLDVRWYRDTTLNPLDPQQGSRLTLITGWAPPSDLTDNPFLSFQGIATWYLPLAERTVLASRLDFGVASPLGDAIDLLPSQRFFAGGFNSMRGYERRRLGPYDTYNEPIGGESRLLASLELRFPIKGILGGNVFLDSGQAWRLREEMTLGNYKAALGVGVMFHTPIGPVHVETAYNVIEPLPDNPWWMYHIGIGHPF